MAKRTGLGKGLEALIPGSDEFSIERTPVEVDIDKIIPNPRQPRKHFAPDELNDLTQSILKHGILQPLIISLGDISGIYVLIAGERRLEAARKAGLKSVPVVVRDTNELQKLELALIENIQREDLNPLEEAGAYFQLADEFNLSHEEISTKVGKNRVTVTNRLRLLKSPDAVKKALIEEKISEGHARALLGLAASEAQIAVLKLILSRELNVRQTEDLVRKFGGERKKKAPSAKNPEDTALEEKLQSSLGTRVKMQSGKKGGSITIFYYSNEELDALIGRLLDG